MAWKRVPAEDNFHGVTVTDPYRWLEQPDDDDTAAFMREQNVRTRRYIDQLPTRKAVASKLKQRFDHAKTFVPQRGGNRYFFLHNPGLWNQPAIFVQEGLAGEPHLLFDPNPIREDGTAAVMSIAPSPDGTLLAFCMAESGSDRQIVYLLDVSSGQLLDEKIHWCKFTNISWTKDGLGFFYARYPEPGTVPEEDQNKSNQIYYHRLGQSQQEDTLVCAWPENKDIHFYQMLSGDGRYLFISASTGTEMKNRLWYLDLLSESRILVKFIDDPIADYKFLDVVDGVVYICTNQDAPNGRIISISLVSSKEEASACKGSRKLREIVRETDSVVDFARLAHGEILVTYLTDAHHQLKRFTLSGEAIGEIGLPTMGTIVSLEAGTKDDEAFFRFHSYLYPPTVFRFHFDTEKLETFGALSALTEFSQDAFETTQVFYTSKDGTRVPMFLTHRKDITLDGSNPTLLYGYGGFNVSVTPGFSPAELAFVEAGGIYAVVCLRGGMEYGESWHQAGMLHNKQNVFDDFIAAAEFLIKEGYTSSNRLCIMGGSNGGLLVSACMLQRPDLFGAVICMVPVTDMFRYHKFTVGHFWIPEYGNAETNKQAFETLRAYSPLHNVASGATYPPILITTGDTDDRVVPAHAMKLTATLQTESAPDNTIYLRIEESAGHGAGKPTSKLIEERADIYAFLYHVFGITNVEYADEVQSM